MLRTSACLPLITPVEFDRKFFTAPEHVVVINTENKSRAYIAVRFRRNIGFYGRFERHVERRLYRYIEGIFSDQSIERGYFDSDSTEYS